MYKEEMEIKNVTSDDILGDFNKIIKKWKQNLLRP